MFERFRTRKEAEPIADEASARAVPVHPEPPVTPVTPVAAIVAERVPIDEPVKPALAAPVGQVASPASSGTPPEPPPRGAVLTGIEAQASRLPRFALIVLTLGGIALTLLILNLGADMIAPVFLALNLMITVYPVHRWLTRQKVPAWISAIVAGLIVIVVLFGFVLGIFWSVAAMVQQLPKYSSQFSSVYASSVEFLTTRFGIDEAILLETLKGIDPQRVLSVAGGLLSNVSGVASLVIVILTSVIFMMMDTSSVDARLAGARTSHPHLVDGFQRFAGGVRSYWLVTTVFGVIVALLDWGVLIGVGVPLAGVWAVFSFLTNYIPNVGFVIGVIPPALLAFFDSGPRSALVILGAYSVLNFVVQSIIQPKFAGDAVGITASMSFFSLLLWTAVFGPLGALLALPTTLLVKALLVDTDPAVRWVNTLVSSRPETGLSPGGSTSTL